MSGERHNGLIRVFGWMKRVVRKSERHLEAPPKPIDQGPLRTDETRMSAEASPTPSPEPLAKAPSPKRRCPTSTPAAQTPPVHSLLAIGSSTQFADTRSGASIDVVIGLDFGTSATKVVIRAPYLESVSPHALPVPDTLQAEKNPHLWKTVIWANSDGSFHIVPQPDTRALEDIKAALMSDGPQRPLVVFGDGGTIYASDAAIAYLAYVFRYARGWFLATKPQAYRRAPLVWQCNVGLPAATYDNNQLVELYRRSVAAAWLLSQKPDAITLSAVRRAFDDPQAIAAARDGEKRAEIGVEVIPEVAAEVVGFARSTRRREGLYALIDVGGGTVDVCTFRLHTGASGIDRYSMFIADVQLQGVEVLRRWTEADRSIDEFRDKVERAMRRVILDTKRFKDLTAREWHDGLPVFLCGGGRASACHFEAVESLGPWLTEFFSTRGSPIIALDCAEDFDAQTDPTDFHRLAVAWGLSYPRFDIGELKAPSEIEDMSARLVHARTDAFISKDQV